MKIKQFEEREKRRQQIIDYAVRLRNERIESRKPSFVSEYRPSTLHRKLSNTQSGNSERRITGQFSLDEDKFIQAAAKLHQLTRDNTGDSHISDKENREMEENLIVVESNITVEDAENK